MHLIDLALSLAEDNAGRSIAARMAMMAMTTSNSIKVKALFLAPPQGDEFSQGFLMAMLTVSDRGSGATPPLADAHSYAPRRRRRSRHKRGCPNFAPKGFSLGKV